MAVLSLLLLWSNKRKGSLSNDPTMDEHHPPEQEQSDKRKGSLSNDPSMDEHHPPEQEQQTSILTPNSNILN